MAYIGNNTSIQQYAPTISYFNGNGSTTVFTLPISVASAAQILVFIENVPQNPSSAFTVSGTTLTFTSAPPSGTSNIWVEYTSLQTNTIAPSNGTVGWNQLTSDVQQDLGISFKNRIINGAMVIDQRNAGAIKTITDTANATYTLDRWFAYGSQASKYSVQQNAGSVTPPTGFTNYAGMTSLSAYTVGASELFQFCQRVEGFNFADLAWGTTNAKTVTLSFWVRSSLTGTFGGALLNNAGNRSYPFSYAISAANTWEQKTITVVGDTTGTWLTTNGTAVNINFSLGTGSSLSGTAGAWSGSALFSATGATSVVGTNGATFYITGIQLEAGTQATAFDYRSYGTELALCQRYLPCFNGTNFIATAINYSSTGGVGYYLYQVQPRVAPTGISVTGTIQMTIPAVGTYTVTPTFASGSLQGTTINTSGSAMGTGSGSLICSSTAQIQFTGCEL